MGHPSPQLAAAISNKPATTTKTNTSTMSTQEKYPDYTEYDQQSIAQKYTKDKKIGEGTYAVVYVGKEVATLRKIAIKKIKLGAFKDGMDLSAIREIKFLSELRHPNIVELIDVFHHKTNLNLVLEYLECDLEGLIRDKSIIFTNAHIKSWMVMLMRGVLHCHKHFMAHRDLKPNNLLISADGVLKIADFGLAREFGSPEVNMTPQAVTRWYRPPELLLGSKKYSQAVDIWSSGCIFAELMLRNPFFAGDSDIDQLNLIYQALGTPTDEDWPDMTNLDNWAKPSKPIPKPDQRRLFSAATHDALDLLMRMLTYSPTNRITAEESLYHPYFTNNPKPTPPERLPKLTRGDEKKEGKKRQRELDEDEELQRIRKRVLF